MGVVRPLVEGPMSSEMETELQHQEHKCTVKVSWKLPMRMHQVIKLQSINLYWTPLNILLLKHVFCPSRGQINAKVSLPFNNISIL